MNQFGRLKAVVLCVGTAVLFFILCTMAPEGLSKAGWRTLGVAAFMASLWVTEAIPFAVTALLPLALFPMFSVCGFTEAAAPFAHPVIFLFFGGILLAQGMERCQLHKRLAFAIIDLAGTHQSALVAAFLICSAFFSMWISNTAVALLMLPIAISTIALSRAESYESFCAALVLAVAYGSSIGGMATLVGTPSNAIFAGFMQESHGVAISFSRWMVLALPVSAVLLSLAWIILTKIVFRLHGRINGVAKSQVHEVPPLGVSGYTVLVVFLLAAMLWILRSFLQGRLPWLSDAGIAMTAGVVLFFLPSGSLQGGAVLNRDALKKIPIDVLLLIGGGLSLAAAVQSSGLAAWIGRLGFHSARVPPQFVLFGVAFTVICLAEFTSNTATTAAFLPVVAALADGLGHSTMTLGSIVVLASSCGFMLPVSTPPNAIVYGSGFVTLPQMLRAGFLMNLGALVSLTLWFGWLVAK